MYIGRALKPSPVLCRFSKVQCPITLYNNKFKIILVTCASLTSASRPTYTTVLANYSPHMMPRNLSDSLARLVKCQKSCMLTSDICIYLLQKQVLKEQTTLCVKTYQESLNGLEKARNESALHIELRDVVKNIWNYWHSCKTQHAWLTVPTINCN